LLQVTAKIQKNAKKMQKRRRRQKEQRLSEQGQLSGADSFAPDEVTDDKGGDGDTEVMTHDVTVENAAPVDGVSAGSAQPETKVVLHCKGHPGTKTYRVYTSDALPP
jgi:hypothetical protein